MFFKQLFAKKSLETLHAEAAGDNRLRRILGPINLTSLGVGAIIGAGIFVMTGRSAALDAGPAILLSFVVAGLGCLFAALCYAEFASLAPVAGSAYTYAYATLGELLAWIIGWDLILEYAMACACVAASWSKYLNELLYVLLSWKVPEFLCNDPFSTFGAAWLNLPALLITVLVTVILVIGIRESATTNAVLVGVKVGVVLFVIGVGVFFMDPGKNWFGRSPSDRIFPEDVTTIPDRAAKAVKEDAMPSAEASKRIDAIGAQMKTVYDEKERLTPDQAAKRLEDLKRQIKAIYEETARLPNSENDKAADARTQQLTAELRGMNQLARTQKEVGAGTKTAADFESLQKSLAAGSTMPAIEADLDQRLANHQINPAQKEDLLGQAQKRDAYLPATPEEEQYVQGLFVDVVKKAPENATEKWGILGYIGLNKYLESVDNQVRNPFMPYGFAGIIFGASIVFFAYIGFDAVSTHSEEAKRPQRDVPIAIIASLIICTVLYLGVSAVLTGMLPYYRISPDAAVANAFTTKGIEQNNNPVLLGASALISIGALAGMTSVLLITFLSQARIFLAMARDRLLPPRIFAAIHPKFRTPHISTMLTGGIIAVVAAITPIRKLEEMVNIGTLMAFIIVCAAVMLLRVQRPDAQRPFRTPLIWVVGPLGILVNLIMMLFLPPDTWLRLVVWLVVGLCIYFFYGMSRSSVGRGLRGLPPNPITGPPADGDKILEKSVMMADPTVVMPDAPPAGGA
jgi:amino acid transporter